MQSDKGGTVSSKAQIVATTGAAEGFIPLAHGARLTSANKGKRAWRKLGPAVAAVAVLVAGFGPPAQAGTQMTASGTFGFDLVSSTIVRTFGDTTVYVVAAGVPYYGGLTGTATDRETDFVNSSGSWAGYGTEVCTYCTLGGRTGGYTAVYTLAGLNYPTTGLPTEGYLIFTGGTGGLTGLHGGGTFGGTVTNPAFYSYNYSFAP
jgi:hypothetical protein